MEACCQLALDGICRGGEVVTSGPATPSDPSIHRERCTRKHQSMENLRKDGGPWGDKLRKVHTAVSCDAVAARNGLWDTLRCRPCHAAAAEQELHLYTHEHPGRNAAHPKKQTKHCLVKLDYRATWV